MAFCQICVEGLKVSQVAKTGNPIPAINPLAKGRKAGGRKTVCLHSKAEWTWQAPYLSVFLCLFIIAWLCSVSTEEVYIWHLTNVAYEHHLLISQRSVSSPPSAIVDLCCESPGAKSTRGKGTPSHPKGTPFVSEKTHLHLYITIIRLLYISLTPFTHLHL